MCNRQRACYGFSILIARHRTSRLVQDRESSDRLAPRRAMFRSLLNEECAPDSLRKVQLAVRARRSEEHTSELQSRPHLVCRLLLEKKKKSTINTSREHVYGRAFL